MRSLDSMRTPRRSTAREFAQQDRNAEPERSQRIAGDETSADERDGAHVFGQRFAAQVRLFGHRLLQLADGTHERTQDPAGAEPHRGRELHESTERKRVRARQKYGIDQKSRRKSDLVARDEGFVSRPRAQQFAKT